MKWKLYFLYIVLILVFFSIFTQGQSIQITLTETHDDVLDFSEVSFYFLNVTDQILSLSASTTASIGIIFYDSTFPSLTELSLLIANKSTSTTVYFQRSFTNSSIDIFYSTPSFGVLAIYSSSIDNPSSFDVALTSSYILTQVSFTTNYNYGTDTPSYATSTIVETSSGSSFFLTVFAISAILFIGGVLYSSKARGHSYPPPRRIADSDLYPAKPVSNQPTSRKKIHTTNTFCPNCGAQLLSTDIFCPECGTKTK